LKVTTVRAAQLVGVGGRLLLSAAAAGPLLREVAPAAQAEHNVQHGQVGGVLLQHWN
jgi:hypothetical protein